MKKIFYYYYYYYYTNSSVIFGMRLVCSAHTCRVLKLPEPCVTRREDVTFREVILRFLARRGVLRLLASLWDAICFTRHPCLCPSPCLCLCPYFPNAYNSVTLYSIPFSFHYISGPRMGFLFHIYLILLITSKYAN